MLRLSDLKGATVTDGDALSTRLGDLAVDLSTGDYPLVTRTLIRDDEGGRYALAAPTRVDRHLVRVPAGARGTPLDEAALDRLVLLRRDIMDAMILDLKDLRELRANDLWLRATDEGIVLAAADISPWAVVRRLTRGLVNHDVPADMIDWRDVEFLRGDPRAAAAGHDYHRRVARLQPTQIARMSDGLPYMHAAELLTLLPDPLAADVLEQMLPERQAQVVTELDEAQAARLIAEMATDLAADLLGQLDLADATHLLDVVPRDRACQIEELLRYPADTAGGIMTNEFVFALVDGTVGDVREYIREQLRRPAFVYFVYLVDGEDSRRLRGIVTLRDLSVADASTPVQHVMQRDVITVGPLEPAIEVAHRVSDYGLNALPVVGPDGTLLGIVALDKAMAQLLPQVWRDHGVRVFS
jgi:magnesium transporter